MLSVGERELDFFFVFRHLLSWPLGSLAREGEERVGMETNDFATWRGKRGKLRWKHIYHCKLAMFSRWSNDLIYHQEEAFRRSFWKRSRSGTENIFGRKRKLFALTPFPEIKIKMNNLQHENYFSKKKKLSSMQIRSLIWFVNNKKKKIRKGRKVSSFA